jgi:hypothetical protein
MNDYEFGVEPQPHWLHAVWDSECGMMYATHQFGPMFAKRIAAHGADFIKAIR